MITTTVKCAAICSTLPILNACTALKLVRFILTMLKDQENETAIKDYRDFNFMVLLFCLYNARSKPLTMEQGSKV